MKHINGPTAEQAHAKAFDRAWDRAAEVKAELLRGLRYIRDDLTRATPDELERLAKLRRELETLGHVLGVDVLR